MTKILTTLLKFLLILLILGAVVVGAYFLCQYLDWPDWMTAIIVVGFLALVAAVVFIRSFLNRRREEGFIRQVIEQEDSAKGGAASSRRQLQDLEQRFQEAVYSIKHSHLRRIGSPLYAMPWYLVIGETGSGKSTALRNSRLPSSFPDVGHPVEAGPTRNCDWWFFENSIFLDLAGRYAIHGGQKSNKDEWKRFLTLLGNTRKREPVNGIVVVLPADKLTREHGDFQEQQGQIVNQAIDQVMRVMGARVPVYLLVSKTDQAIGMNAFCQLLPWKAYKQAMGNINRDLSPDYIGFLDDTINSVTERLKDLRLLLLDRAGAKDPEVMVFPEELRTLRPGIAAFIRGAFQDNPYQETPLLRGIYFASGRQEGNVSSGFLKSTGVDTQVEEELPGTNRGLFLQDFFSKILPADRYLFTPVKEFIRWRRSTRDMGLVAIIGLAVLITGLLAFSFVKNLYAIESFKEKFVKPPVLEGNISEEIILMEHFRKEISGLEELNRNWWLPRMGLNQSKYQEESLKRIYLQMFEDGLLHPIDEKMQERIAGFDRNTPDLVVGLYAEHLAKRINLNKARLAHNDLAAMQKMPQPSTAVVLLLDKTLLPAVAGEFNSLYIYYLKWHTSPEILEIKQQELRSRLVRLLKIKGDNMKWLAAWANAKEDLKPVLPSEFWTDRVVDPDQIKIKVPPAYTVAGNRKVDEFIEQIEDALSGKPEDEAVLSSRRAVFEDWYARQYYQAWHEFARGCLNKEQRLQKPKEVTERSRSTWHRLAVSMTTFSNPYFELIGKMAEQLDHLKKRSDAPAWVGLVMDFQAMKSQLESKGFMEEGLSLAKSVKKVAASAGKSAKAGKASSTALESHMKAVEELQAFKKALQAVSPVLDSDNHAYQVAAQLFKEGPGGAASKSPFTEAYLAKKRLEARMGEMKSEERIFWDLLEAPVNFLLYYTCRETACSLQTTWEERVLAEVQGVSQRNMQKELFDEGGVVWEFTGGPADPFLGRNEKGFYSRKSYNQKLPFIISFLDFLKEGALGRHKLQEEYEVRIEAFPTNVNLDAAETPEVVVVEMICSDNLYKIENYNYPVSRTFKWSPQDCGGLKMEIKFRTFSIAKTYPHYSGFPRFLVDFKTGGRTFIPEDFPLYKSDLNKRSIKWIKVRFAFSGHEPVMELVEKTPLVAPRNIVYCWK